MALGDAGVGEPKRDRLRGHPSPSFGVDDELRWCDAPLGGRVRHDRGDGPLPALRPTGPGGARSGCRRAQARTPGSPVVGRPRHGQGGSGRAGAHGRGKLSRSALITCGASNQRSRGNTPARARRRFPGQRSPPGLGRAALRSGSLCPPGPRSRRPMDERATGLAARPSASGPPSARRRHQPVAWLPRSHGRRRWRSWHMARSARSTSSRMAPCTRRWTDAGRAAPGA